VVSEFSVPLFEQYAFFWFFQRSENEEEIELQQGTPDI
jgi:hypothetical protein